jgi:predicted Zn-dependent protease
MMTRKGLAQAKINLAILFMDGDNFKTAEELLNDGRKILDTMAEENEYLFRLSILHMRATAYFNAGIMNKRKSREANDTKTRTMYDKEAIKNFMECRSIAKRLISMDRENAEYMLQLCQSQYHIADIEMRELNYSSAKDLCTDTLHLVDKLREKAPHNADYATLRAELLTVMATILSKNDELPNETQLYFAEARETLAKLLEQSPNNPMLKFSYANALAESAAHAYRINEPQTAQAWLQEAEYYLDKLTPLAKNNEVWASRLQLIRNMLRSSGVPGKYNHSENQP